MMCCPYCGHSPQGYTQYVGTSLKVNGPFYRDAYTMTAILTPPDGAGQIFFGQNIRRGGACLHFSRGGTGGFQDVA